MNGETIAKSKRRRFHSGGSISLTDASGKYYLSSKGGSTRGPPSMRVLAVSGVEGDAKKTRLVARAELWRSRIVGMRIVLMVGGDAFLLFPTTTGGTTFSVYRPVREKKPATQSKKRAPVDGQASKKKGVCVGVVRLCKTSIRKDRYELSFCQDVPDILPLLSLMLVNTFRQDVPNSNAILLRLPVVTLLSAAAAVV